MGYPRGSRVEGIFTHSSRVLIFFPVISDSLAISYRFFVNKTCKIYV